MLFFFSNTLQLPVPRAEGVLHAAELCNASPQEVVGLEARHTSRCSGISVSAEPKLLTRVFHAWPKAPACRANIY